ncbi:Putative conjugal transfer protein [Roseivivax sp. THAF30]|nr:Putative conjugal transfer protein [Roseivivax sp. THAF30]
MSVHMFQPSHREALEKINAIAARIDIPGLSAQERANNAVSFFVESSNEHWPLASQIDLLHAATAALEAQAERDNKASAKPEGRPTTATPGPETRPQLQPVAEMPRPARTPAPMPVPVPASPSAPSASMDSSDVTALSGDVIRSLSRTLDFSDLAAQSREEQESAIHQAIRALSDERKLHLNGREIADLVRAVLADMLGLGPLEALLSNDEITDIMVNGPRRVFIERNGKLELTDVRFRDDTHVRAVASRIVSEVGRRIDESQPMVDARLADGSRVNVAIPPLAIDGPTITIRKFPAHPIGLDTLVQGGSLTSQMAGFLSLAAHLRLNILISGGTGSGKTTLMNALSQYIPEDERLVTIEDAAELRLQQPHVVRFETRPPNVEGTGEVTMRTLVRNALRMRPDRIIIGEIRGDEVLDLLQAMNTGHDGSMSTLHANSPREALTRVESMASLAGFNPGTGVVRRQLAEAVNLVVQVSRMRDGKRRITSISEIAGMAEDVITLQDIFTFETDPRSTRNRVIGDFRYTGFRPKCAARAADYGVIDDLNAVLGH